MVIKTKTVMPWFAIIVALAFTGIDTFTDIEISDTEMASIYTLLTPFGLASIVKSGYELHKKSKLDAANLTPAEEAKLKELLGKVGLK